MRVCVNDKKLIQNFTVLVRFDLRSQTSRKRLNDDAVRTTHLDEIPTSTIIISIRTTSFHPSNEEIWSCVVLAVNEMISKSFAFFQVVAMWCAVHRLSVRVSAFSFNSAARRFNNINHNNVPKAAIAALQMSSSTGSASTPPIAVIPRVKACDATDASEGPVLIKGWVRTVRKQKEVAFVQINDGSNLGGIQCVVPLKDIDDDTKKGRWCYCMFLRCLRDEEEHFKLLTPHVPKCTKKMMFSRA